MKKNVETIKEEIERLPKGYISNKTINGKVHHYLQWNENGKIKSKYIPDSLYDEVKDKLEEKKKLQKELKAASTSPVKEKRTDFKTSVIIDDGLESLASSVRKLEKRDCYKVLHEYLYSELGPRICSIYGLRRTGKTTMIFQAILEMGKEDFAKSAYIKIRKGQRMSMLDEDLKKLQSLGFKYIFIDEITLMDDFIDASSFLSDIYAAMGMKIVISGTDSLGIYLASKSELYDRTYFVHTTWIPYSEHSRLLAINDIDEYIRYGGTLRVGETNFDDDELKEEEISFRDDESTRRYIDTAICGNIQHSLKCFEDGSHFRKLRELYEKGELTNAINRVIESMNHRFVVDVITNNFKSHDLGVAKKNLLREKTLSLRTDILERIDERNVTERLMKILEIENKKEQEIDVTPEHIREIKEYLNALELIEECPVRYLGGQKEDEDKNVLFTQPGMRYCQAEALIYSLKKDSAFSSISEQEKDYVCKKILDEVKGRMLEEIVLYETMRKLRKKFEVFKLEFIDGEFDMVKMNKETYECEIFEIKHSKIKDPSQYRHISNEERCKETERYFGKITSKYVLYRGEDDEIDGIKYLNASEYLKNL